MKSIDSINNLNKSDFLTIFGNVFEKTDWIPEKVFELKPFKDFNDFSSKIFGLYENSQKKNILLILNSHPDISFTADDATFHALWKVENKIQFLLLKRAGTKNYEHLWQGVAGKIEKGESAWQAALRELDEETSLKPKCMFIYFR